jgi:hypothetical protein
MIDEKHQEVRVLDDLNEDVLLRILERKNQAERRRVSLLRLSLSWLS